jgi:hypothetical protein
LLRRQYKYKKGKDRKKAKWFHLCGFKLKAKKISNLFPASFRLSLFTETNSPEQNLWIGNELLQTFNSFLAFNVEHMKKEETIINAVLWKHYTDAQLLQKVQQISASMPIEENIAHSTWMLKGLAVHEITTWYKDIQRSAPTPVFEKFCQLAEKTLTPSKWDCVREALRLTILS